MRVFLRTGVRLAARRTVVGVAVVAAILCCLGSFVLQELAHSQRASYNAQLAYAKRAGAKCVMATPAQLPACRVRHGVPDPNAVRLYSYETDILGARARAVQTLGGSVQWAQAWLVTLLGLVALLIGVALTTAADVEARRLVSGWHPTRASRGPLIVTATAGLCAAAMVSGGAAVGAVLAAVAGARIWPLESEPHQIDLQGAGPVALLHPSLSWLVAWLSVVAAVVLVCWFAGRTLVAILGGGTLFGVLALLSDTLPSWFPWAELPSTSGMWFHHRGEITHLWRWPVTPTVSGSPAVDWTLLTPTDPHMRALVGAAVALGAAVLVLPWAARRTLD